MRRIAAALLLAVAMAGLHAAVAAADEPRGWHPKLGDALKKKFAGWRSYFFTADLRLPKLIRLEPSARTPLWNGALECRLYEFEIVSGSHRR